MASRRRWMQEAFSRHKGALHRDLGVPVGEPIPPKLLAEAIKHPEHFKSTVVAQRRLRRRAQLVITARRLARRRRRR